MELSIFNFFSYLVHQAIERGVPTQTMVYILMFPLIATFVALIRQVIGIKTFGVFLPSILTISFLATGLLPGIIIFIVILISGTVLRFLLQEFRLLYLPRVALLISIISLIAVGLIIIAAYLNIGLASELLAFPILIMIIIVERFIAVQTEKGYESALLLTGETLLISIIGYFILNSMTLQNFILDHPGFILILIIFDIILARWTGLRLVEYLRFRELRKRA